jgi:hypothetical protein
MKIAYLNRWSDLFHLMLADVDGDVHRRVESRFCRSLDDARRLLAHWQVEHGVGPENVRDNSRIDLDVLLAHMDVDLEGVAESEVAGVLH